MRLTRKFKIYSSGKLFFESVHKYDIMSTLRRTVKIINTIKNTISTFIILNFTHMEGWKRGREVVLNKMVH